MQAKICMQKIKMADIQRKLCTKYGFYFDGDIEHLILPAPFYQPRTGQTC